MRKDFFLSSLVIFVAGFALSAIVDGRRLAFMAPGTVSKSLAPEVTAQIARQPSAILNWEYRSVNTAGNTRNDQGGLDPLLNQLGRQGFELCAIIQSPVGDHTIVFKRPR